MKLISILISDRDNFVQSSYTLFFMRSLDFSHCQMYLFQCPLCLHVSTIFSYFFSLLTASATQELSCSKRFFSLTVISTDCELRNWTVFNSSIHGGEMQSIDSLGVNLFYFPANSIEERIKKCPSK